MSSQSSCASQYAGTAVVFCAYLVGHNPETALLSVGALLQDIVDESKELLHDCVLSHVIITRLDLRQAATQIDWGSQRYLSSIQHRLRAACSSRGSRYGA